MFTLRKIDHRDTDLLSKLCAETFIQAYENVHTKSDLDTYCRKNYSLDAIKTLLNSNDTDAVIAFQNAEPAGFYTIRHHPCPIELDGQSTELKQIYVLSGHFGSGLGRKLFENAVSHTQENNSHWLWLCVSDINYRAQTFYEKIGFSKIGQGPVLKIGNDNLSSSIMVLSID